MSVNFTVTAAPHIRNNETTRKIMADVLIALVPALIAAIILFGLRSARARGHIRGGLRGL